MALPVRPILALTRGNAQVALVRPVASRHRAFQPLASSKGFGSEEDAAAQQNGKVNARGKVSSRPGPVSPSAAPAKAPTAGDLIASPSSSSSSPPTTTGSPAPRSSVAAAAVRSTPQAVVDRIFGRMLLFSGVPVFLGLAALPLFYFLKVKQQVDFPMWLVYATQTLTFGGGLLGITYGALSASWDPTREGSLLGWQELRGNVALLVNKDKK